MATSIISEELFSIILAIALSAGTVFTILMMVRNQWVYRNRMRILKQRGCEAYERLPTYEYMMWHFWIWDVNKFLGRGGK